MVRIIARKEFLAGLLFAAIGIASLCVALGYRLGTATEMGPGFVPTGLSILLIGLGTAAALRAVRLPTAEVVARFPVAATLRVLGGVALFGLIMPIAGLVPATLALVLIACLPRLRSAPVETLVLAVLLAALAAGLFVFGLGMPFQLV